MTSSRRLANVFAELIFWVGLLGVAVWSGSIVIPFCYEYVQLAWNDQYRTGFVDGLSGDMRIAYQQSLPDFLLKVVLYIGSMLLFCSLVTVALCGIQSSLMTRSGFNRAADEESEAAVNQPEIIIKDGRRYYLIAVPPGTSADDENLSSLTT